MKKTIFYGSRDDAIKEAQKILWSEVEPTYTGNISISTSVYYAPTTSKSVPFKYYERNDDKKSPITYVTHEDGEQAIVIGHAKGGIFQIVRLSEDEALGDCLTYPFRLVKDEFLGLLMGDLQIAVIKPEKEIPAADAATEESLILIYNHFEGEELTEAEARQRLEIREEPFLYYCLYEFSRTESYDRLKEVTKAYGKFGLPESWEEKAEAWTLQKYLPNEATDFALGASFAQTSLKEIAEYTGVPVEKLIKAKYGNKVWH